MKLLDWKAQLALALQRQRNPGSVIVNRFSADAELDEVKGHATTPKRTGRNAKSCGTNVGYSSTESRNVAPDLQVSALP